MGAERSAEEFSRFSTEECELASIYILVSLLSGFSAFPRLPRFAPRYFRGCSIPNIPPFENEDVDEDVNVQLLRSEISVLWMISYLEEKSLMGADLIGLASRTYTC